MATLVGDREAGQSLIEPEHTPAGKLVNGGIRMPLGDVNALSSCSGLVVPLDCEPVSGILAGHP